MSLFAFNKMQAKPDKLQKIAISSKTHKQNIVCDLYGSKINCDDEVKLLGITIDFTISCKKNRTGFVYDSVDLQCHGPQPSDLQRL
jgi:hypothetical protein